MLLTTLQNFIDWKKKNLNLLNTLYCAFGFLAYFKSKKPTFLTEDGLQITGAHWICCIEDIQEVKQTNVFLSFHSNHSMKSRQKNR